MPDDGSHIRFIRSAPDVQLQEILAQRDAALRLYTHLTALVEDARLIRKCPEYDACDVCRAEAAITAFRQKNYSGVLSAR